MKTTFSYILIITLIVKLFSCSENEEEQMKARILNELKRTGVEYYGPNYVLEYYTLKNERDSLCSIKIDSIFRISENSSYNYFEFGEQLADLTFKCIYSEKLITDSEMEIIKGNLKVLGLNYKMYFPTVFTAEHTENRHRYITRLNEIPLDSSFSKYNDFILIGGYYKTLIYSSDIVKQNDFRLYNFIKMVFKNDLIKILLNNRNNIPKKVLNRFEYIDSLKIDYSKQTQSITEEHPYVILDSVLAWQLVYEVNKLKYMP